MKRERGIQKKHGFLPVRIAAVCLFALVLYMSFRIPAMTAQAEKVKQDLQDHSESYFNSQAKFNRLKKEMDEINTNDFVERTARRNLGYVWYGETIYTVSNIAELTKMDEHYDFVYNGADEPVIEDSGILSGESDAAEIEETGN